MGPAQVVDSLRGSAPAPIGWARRPPGGPHEGACVDRTTDPTPGPGRLQPDPPEPPDPPGRTRRRTLSPATTVVPPALSSSPWPSRVVAADPPSPHQPAPVTASRRRPPWSGGAACSARRRRAAGRSAGPPASGGTPAAAASAPSGSAGVPGREAERQSAQAAPTLVDRPPDDRPGSRAPRDASGRAPAGCGHDGSPTSGRWRPSSLGGPAGRSPAGPEVEVEAPGPGARGYAGPGGRSRARSRGRAGRVRAAGAAGQGAGPAEGRETSSGAGVDPARTRSPAQPRSRSRFAGPKATPPADQGDRRAGRAPGGARSAPVGVGRRGPEHRRSFVSRDRATPNTATDSVRLTIGPNVGPEREPPGGARRPPLPYPSRTELRASPSATRARSRVHLRRFGDWFGGEPAAREGGPRPTPDGAAVAPSSPPDPPPGRRNPGPASRAAAGSPRPGSSAYRTPPRPRPPSPGGPPSGRTTACAAPTLEPPPSGPWAHARR